MATYTVDVSGLDSVVARIRALQDAGQSLQPLHERIGAGLLSNVQLGFRTGTSPWGIPWTPLKLRRGQPLRNTGRLRNSITSQADASGVTVGTNVRYAAIHQFGGVIKAKNAPFLMFPVGGGRFARKKSVTIPARPFLPLKPSGQGELPPAYARTVTERIRAHFLDAAN